MSLKICGASDSGTGMETGWGRGSQVFWQDNGHLLLNVNEQFLRIGEGPLAAISPDFPVVDGTDVTLTRLGDCLAPSNLVLSFLFSEIIAQM